MCLEFVFKLFYLNKILYVYCNTIYTEHVVVSNTKGESW